MLGHITVLYRLFLIHFVLHIWTAGILFPAGAGVFFSVLHSVPTVPGAHSASYRMCTGWFFVGVNETATWNWPFASVAKVKNVGTVSPLLHTSSWPDGRINHVSKFSSVVLQPWMLMGLHPTYTHSQTNLFFSCVVCYWTEVCCVVSSVSLIVQLSGDDVWMEASLITGTTV